MKSIAFSATRSAVRATCCAAVLATAMAGCAIVPIGPPPIYIGIHAGGGYGHGGYRY